LIDRIMAGMRLRQTTIMVLRSIIRWPVRSMLTAAGLGAATSTVIAAGFMNGSLNHMIDLAFNQSYRGDAMILLTRDMPRDALPEVARLPGVLQVEPQQFHAATLRNGPREKRVSLEARPSDATLSRVIGADGRAITAPPGGILLSERLAAALDLSVGETVEVAFMTGRRETHDLLITGLVEQYLGLGAYADIDFLDAQFRRSPRMSTVNVLIDERHLPELHAALQETPALAGLISMTDNRRSFEETISANITVVNSIYAAIAILITVGVAYNGARIQMSERARELASLRILGFSRAEVSSVLVGETMVLAILAQPLGWLMGAWIATALSNSFSSDLYAVPLVLEPAIFARASLVVLAASLVSVLLVRRRIDRMDLVAVMKTRE
jgi:putative ABC transport system permease protein